MSVAAQRVDYPGAGQIEHPGAGRFLDEEVRGRLHQRALAGEPPQALDQVRSQVALGMGDQGAEPPLTEPVDGFVKRVIECPRCGLEQDPAPRSPQRDPGQLVVVQPVQRSRRDLAAGEDPRPAPGGGDRHRQLIQARRQLADPHIVVVADVGSGADCLDPVCLSLPGHPERVVKVPGAVVELRQDVAVKIDQRRRLRGLRAHHSRPGGGWARVGNARRSVRIRLIQGFVLKQCVGQRVELFAMLAQRL